MGQAEMEFKKKKKRNESEGRPEKKKNTKMFNKERWGQALLGWGPQ